MIEARGLTKKYGDTVAVDNLSFTVEPGRITGFLGPNGAGKTTTMRLYVALCGLFAFGFGAILRSTAGAITAAYGFLFLLPQLAKALPSTWYADVVRWLPGGDVIAEITGTSRQQISTYLFPAWGEFAVFGVYTVIVLAVGAVLFLRRDA